MQDTLPICYLSHYLLHLYEQIIIMLVFHGTVLKFCKWSILVVLFSRVVFLIAHMSYIILCCNLTMLQSNNAAI